MASILEQVAVEVEPDEAWAVLRDVGEAHRLFAPVLAEARLDGDIRTVRFANGMTVRERIVAIDDEQHRVAYSAQDVPGLTYHHSSMQIVNAGSGRCLFVWITDFLPKEMEGSLRPLIQQGARALKSNLEGEQPASATGNAELRA